MGHDYWRMGVVIAVGCRSDIRIFGHRARCFFCCQCCGKCFGRSNRISGILLGLSTISFPIFMDNLLISRILYLYKPCFNTSICLAFTCLDYLCRFRNLRQLLLQQNRPSTIFRFEWPLQQFLCYLLRFWRTY